MLLFYFSLKPWMSLQFRFCPFNIPRCINHILWNIVHCFVHFSVVVSDLHKHKCIYAFMSGCCGICIDWSSYLVYISVSTFVCCEYWFVCCEDWYVRYMYLFLLPCVHVCAFMLVSISRPDLWAQLMFIC